MTLHLLLAEQATRIAVATTLEDASSAYFVARGAFYAADDEGTASEADRFAWGWVLDEMKSTQDRLATPVEPLVVFA